jgi:hypothetical protein
VQAAGPFAKYQIFRRLFSVLVLCTETQWDAMRGMQVEQRKSATYS